MNDHKHDKHHEFHDNSLQNNGTYSNGTFYGNHCPQHHHDHCPPDYPTGITIVNDSEVTIGITQSITTVNYRITVQGFNLFIETFDPLGIRTQHGDNGGIFIIPTHLN